MPRERATAFGPGRINIIGEHTDYNDGLSLPFAITEGVTVRAVVRDGDRVRTRSAERGETDCFALGDPGAAAGWRAFARGSVAELRAAGYRIPAVDLAITSTLAEGVGLSSSAALAVALCLGLLALVDAEEIERVELARICSRVENRWVGARTGLLDQLAVLNGQAGQALRIDFRSLDVRPIPLDLEGWRFVSVDSGGAHAHGSSGYNARREECELARQTLGLASLRDAQLDQAADLPEPLDRRLRHVICENVRVDRFIEALRAKDTARLGHLLDASHASLRDLYDASTDAVEQTVLALKHAGAVGARMVGGGFGGQVLGLFAPGETLPDGARIVEPAMGARLLDVG